MTRLSAWFLALAVTPAAAFAQPSAPAPEKSGKAIDEVVVTAPSQAQTRVEIDRRSYDVSKSVQAESGTLADLLRTVPSVDVDAQGTVSLRGDQGVTIMIDGKPSGIFRGDARASAVQNLPASQFERVEVITNPSAADSPEGVSGIINLVSKQARKAGGSGSARIGVGSLGQYNGGISGTYNTAKLTLSGDFSGRDRDPQTGRVTEDRRQVVGPGNSRASRQTGRYDGANSSMTGRLGADYDLDARTRIGAQVRGLSIRADRDAAEHLETLDSLGAVTIFDRLSDRTSFKLDDREVSGSFRRKLGDDQEFTTDLRQERLSMRADRFDRNISTLPAVADQFLQAFTSQTTNVTGLKADYKNPLVSGELKFGYDGRFDRTTSEVLFGQGLDPAARALIPDRSGAYDYRLDLNGVYGTLSRRFGDLTMLAGLRVENSKTTVVAPGQRYVVDLTRPYPSLHLSYPLGADTKITGSYSRRVERPAAGALSPLVQYGDRQTLYRGNPLLRPQETDSFELAYDTRKGASTLAATLFYRQLHDAFTQVVQDQGGVLLFTQDNLGEVRRAGLSLAINRTLRPKLTLNVSGDGYWTEIPASSLGFGEARSTYVVSGRGSLTWTPTANDLFQVDGRLSGKTLTPQGNVSPVGVLNLGYRRKLSPSLFVNVTAQNVLDTNRNKIVFRSPGLDYQRRAYGVGPSVNVTLTYNFGAGARRPREPGFDFGSGAPPAPTP